jgi:amino acid adenylation domain-containing protein
MTQIPLQENVCESPCGLFARQAAQTPDAAAVVFQGKIFSYREIDRQASCIAAALKKQGVGRNTRVGLHLDRSAAMLAAMLGIHKAGGAYVPLDPSYPADRLDFIVMDSGMTHLVHAGNPSVTCLPAHTLHLNDAFFALTSDAFPPEAQAASDLAYIIYTSGSTGKPKGVKIPHGALHHFLQNMRDKPGMDSKDILLAITTISFDISVLELFLPLIVGAKIILAAKEDVIDGRALAELLDTHAVTLLQATPTTWRMLLASGWAGSPRLKALCGGEKLDHRLAGLLFSATGSLWNMYGPTETTVWSTCGRITDPSGVISVGEPIGETSLHILDENRCSVRPGGTGELYIGGAGVALGYTDAALTEDRFILAGTERLYKTGDRASLLPDGTLDIKGRLDFQVKIKGHRVELSEVEKALGDYDGIDQVVVIARENTSGDHTLVAYLAADGLNVPDLRGLGAFLENRLPAYMIPARFIPLSSFPQTPNGKIDRVALAANHTGRDGPIIPEDFVYNGPADLLTRILCRLTDAESIDPDASFFDLGIDSLQANRMAALFSEHAGLKISVARFFEYPTVNRFVHYLEGSQFIENIHEKVKAREGVRRKACLPQDETEGKIAIIGMAGRFPGADTLEGLWHVLENGMDTITRFSREEDDFLVGEEIRNDPHYIRARGMLGDPKLFDAAFFGIRPNDAAVMDPQQRVFLEVAWEALENAACDADRYNGLIGVYAGMGNNFYYHYNVSTHPRLIKMVGEVQVEIGREKDHVATLVSHRLNFTGPSVSVHTACSTALVAIDSACHSLLGYQCDMAIAGGIEIRTPQMSGQVHEPEGIFTRDGRCCPFSSDASGTMFSDGAGAVVLKRLKDAIEDRDTIHAVILGSAVNHDGLHKKSYLAPSVKGQIEVIATAQARARVAPESITYMEAHGTGTPVGDPIEFEALKKVFEFGTNKKNYCALGSVKANLGHPTTAAGVVGVIKTVLALQHKKIPPLVHFNGINPNIDIDNSPFFINTQLIDWEGHTSFPRRGAVSSFGFCGTNAHVILEEAPQGKRAEHIPARPVQIVMLSAATETALPKMMENLAGYLRSNPSIALEEVAHTLNAGRKRLRHRRFAVCRSREDAVNVLLGLKGASMTGRKAGKVAKPCFLFPGQGTQYVNMGQDLYRQEPVFREHMDRCAEILETHIGEDIRDVMMGAAPDDFQAREAKLNDTYYTQMALFCLEYSLARLWMQWGIQPAAMAGHSVGEFVCATLAGVFSLENALKLIANRCMLMRQAPKGAMLSVRFAHEALRPHLGPDISVAAINSPDLCVVSGKKEDIEALKKDLEEKKILCRPLHTSHAFHSWMMEPVVAPFLEIVRSVTLNAPRLPIISTVTGQKMSDAEAKDPHYWANHLRVTVQFAKAVSTLWASDNCLLLEIGPRGTLSSLALSQVKYPGRQSAVPSLSDTSENNAESAALAQAMGLLWLHQVEPDWEAYNGARQYNRIPLPSYPFERKPYWVDPAYLPAAEKAEDTSGAIPISGIIVPPPLPGITAIPGVSTRLHEVRGILESVSGANLQEADPSASFFEMGLDSLLLTAIAFALNERYGIKITFRQLLKETATLESLTAMIEKSLAEKEQAGGTAKNIAALADPSWIPVTPGQRQWLVQAEGAAPLACMESACLRFKGNMDRAALLECLQELYQTYDVLRASFSAGGEFFHIGSYQPLSIPVVILADTDDALARSIEEVLRFPFDLKEGPLFRAALFHMGEREHAVLMTAHPAVCDRWSMDILIEELGKIYFRRLSSSTSHAADPAAAYSFPAYALDKQALLASARYREQEAYWLAEYPGIPEAPLLLVKTPPLNADMYAAEQIGIEMSPVLVQRVKELGQENKCSLFTMLFAALNAVLHRHSQQENIVVAIPIAGQSADNHPGLVGQCTSMVAVHSRMDDGSCFNGYAGGLQEKIIEAYENREYSCADIMKRRDPQGYEKGRVFPSITFSHTKALKDEQCAYPGLAMRYHFNPPRQQTAELCFNAMEYADRITFECSFKTALFDTAFICDLLKEIVRQLSEACDNPAGELVVFPSFREMQAQKSPASVAS